MNKLLGAWTGDESGYPPFVNFYEKDGRVTITLREPQKEVKWANVCSVGFHKRGVLGYCTPGDNNCNNYCNLAPEKGDMQDSPSKVKVPQCGNSLSMQIPLEAFTNLIYGTLAKLSEETSDD